MDEVPFKDRVFLALLDYLADLEAGLGLGFDVQDRIDVVHALLRQMPFVSIITWRKTVQEPDGDFPEEQLPLN